MENNLIYTAHALNQMFKRSITTEEIKHVLTTGTIIKEYPEDTPYPSFLMLGFCNKRPLHVVFSINGSDDKIIITAYEPGVDQWNEEFNKKK